MSEAKRGYLEFNLIVDSAQGVRRVGRGAAGIQDSSVCVTYMLPRSKEQV
jgi:hypothetical protein